MEAAYGPISGMWQKVAFCVSALRYAALQCAALRCAAAYGAERVCGEVGR